MFSFFKSRKPPAPVEVTFKARVARFWTWYASVAERFYQTIEDKRCADLTPEISARVDELISGIGWVFGPGEGQSGHSLTLTGEGDTHRQLLTVYWLAQAPKLPGWTFHSARQPSPEPGAGHLKINELDFDPKAFWLTPDVDAERKCIHLTVWHPLFSQIEERTRWTVLFLFLDEALGELGTQNWIGKVEMNDTRLTEAMPLGELRSFTEKIRTEHAWEKSGPGETWSVYRFNEVRSDYPRGDILTGSTCVMPLIDDFSEAEGKLEDPLAGSGADYIYVTFDAGILPRGEEADARGRIEDALEAALAPTQSGRVIGGALGRSSAYIDLLLFDGTSSVTLVLDTLRRLNLPAGTSINYFADEKRGHRRVL